jgi:hypothetical protein
MRKDIDRIIEWQWFKAWCIKENKNPSQWKTLREYIEKKGEK